MRIALIGGSFNPPHVGHLLSAHYVRATQGVDEVWLVPSFQHPFGKALAAFEHRVAMCQTLSADTSGWLRTSTVEAEIQGDGSTVETLGFLRRARPDDSLLWVIGSDILPDLHRWKDFSRIESLAQVLVLHRSGYPSTRALGPALALVSSKDIRERLLKGESCEELIPSVVLNYLLTHRLYAPPP